jgi:hypothetical protein
MFKTFATVAGYARFSYGDNFQSLASNGIERKIHQEGP